MFAFVSLTLNAKDKAVPSVIHSWHYTDALGIADSLALDTGYIDLPMKDVINDYSIANSYNGNLVSPIQSKLFFDRDNKIDFLFGNAYTPYIITYKDVRFYTTTTPYSGIAYKKDFTTYKEGNDLDFFFTGNVTKNCNLGLTLNLLSSVGHYQNQAGKRFNGSVFGSYKGTHYSCHGAVTFNTLSNFENGGLTSTDYLGGELSSSDIPVNMEAMSGFRYFSGFFNHKYSICVERERKVTPDSVVTEYVPVTTFMHTLDIHQATKRYLEKTSRQGVYGNTYYNTRATNDTANVLTIKNTLAVTFEEEFNRVLKFGAMVYAANEFQRYAFSCPDNTPWFDTGADDISFMGNCDLTALSKNPLHMQSDTVTAYKWTNNTWVGGSLYKNMGKYVHYGFNGDVCVVGYKIGEFQVNGHVDGDFRIGKDTMYIKAKASFQNETPDYFLQHYRSNHYIWENDFQKPYILHVGGEVAYPTRYVQPSVKVDFDNITKYIYFGENGLPQQFDGNIQVLAVNAQVNIRTKRFGMDNNVVYQVSSSEHIPLPAITLYHNIYYQDTWFKALGVQIGVDMRFHTKYYAPLLDPATGQFCEQSSLKIGNYPVLNVYANFYVKSLRLRFFAQFQHFNEYFMKQKEYFSMVGYPLNPPLFRAGLAWQFYK